MFSFQDILLYNLPIYFATFILFQKYQKLLCLISKIIRYVISKNHCNGKFMIIQNCISYMSVDFSMIQWNVHEKLKSILKQKRQIWSFIWVIWHILFKVLLENLTNENTCAVYQLLLQHNHEKLLNIIIITMLVVAISTELRTANV